MTGPPPGTASGTPHPSLGTAVWGYRGFHLVRDHPLRRLVLPTAGATLVVLLSGDVRLTGTGGGAPSASFTSLFAGPRSEALVYEHGGRLHGVQVALAPWAAYTLLGTAVDHLANAVVDARTVLGDRVGQLARALRAAPSWPGRFGVLDRALGAWLACGPAPAPPVALAWRRLAACAGAVSVAGLAGDIGWCQSQLERRFREQVGLTPKTVARVLRLQRGVRLLAAGHTAAEAASEAGYHDQSHLSREFKAMTGYPPRRLLSSRGAPFSRTYAAQDADGPLFGYAFPC
ncbi:helix-turn-helix domain-containing protein [Streptomyces sp. NPDC003077]|uniref:helix-turn-helix domain-containing protein n=1 Tax=Streptomyces sp. NPDC003077 TaxID=3154443 RepID=UPI0033BE95BB